MTQETRTHLLNRSGARWPEECPRARRDEGASPSWGCDREVTTPEGMAPASPEGGGSLARRRRCSSVEDRCGYSPSSSQNREELPALAGCLAATPNLSPRAPLQFMKWVLVVSDYLTITSYRSAQRGSGLQSGLRPGFELWRKTALGILIWFETVPRPTQEAIGFACSFYD